MPYAADFTALCLKQAGEQYVYGAEVNLNDPDPPGPWDCSELVQWATFRLGGSVAMPDGSAAQLAYCKSHQCEIPVQEAIGLQGALLFGQTKDWHHVAVSLGNGSTIEARGKAYGVNRFPANNRGWTNGGIVPGLTYAAPVPAPIPGGQPSNTPPWPGRYITQPPAMKGNDVRQWQAQMRNRGWNIATDGVYGPKSEEVCRQFQKQKNIQVDGVVGPTTWKAAWAAPVT